MKLIIQIPCYNEEKTLPETFSDLPRHIDGVDCIEYLIIDDGSSDKTVECAKDLGIHHVVKFKQNKGLAKGFMAGIDASLHLGADIIVNTDADNQYCGEDIKKLVQPIIDNKADMVIGERPIDQTEHFTWKKKKFQHLGSWVVRMASNTDIPDAPSGFRAYSREAALQLNVTNEYTYTLETIIQAGRNKIALTSVPIRTNKETRKSRLFSSIWIYMKRSSSVIIRAFMMYKPLKFFCTIGAVIFTLGIILGLRYIVFLLQDTGSGHVQSLILVAILLMIGFQTFIVGLLADIIAANRKLLEDVQYRIRKMECSSSENNEIEIIDDKEIKAHNKKVVNY
ncbi:MAG: glycosyltransferase family 2 protein [Anaerocolumna sp.]